MHTLDALNRAGSLFGSLLQFAARRLACEQYHAVVTGHDNVRGVAQVRMGFGDVHCSLGFDQRVVDFAADGAGASVVVNGAVAGGGQHRAAAAGSDAQGECEQMGTQWFHSSLPNSWLSIRSHRQWMASR